MIHRAETLVREMLTGLGYQVLSFDDPSWQRATLPAARCYYPVLLSVGVYSHWLCTVDIGAKTHQEAVAEGDRLLAAIARDPYRYPSTLQQPTARIIREVGWVRCNIQFTLLTDQEGS